MKMIQGRKLSIALSAAPIVALCCAGFAAAQGPRPQPAAARKQPAQTRGAPRENIDQYLAEDVALENDNAVTLAKMAQSHADNKDVVKFAAMLQKEHEQFARIIAPFAGEIASRRNHQGNESASGKQPGSEDATNDRSETTNRKLATPQKPAGIAPRPPADPANAQESGPSNMFQEIKLELADACLESAQRELKEKKGADFDTCYLGMTLAAHMMFIDTLMVYEKHSSPELQQVFQKGQETAQKHLDEAKKLMKGLDGVRTARRDNDE